ncbi:MAG TPA: OB-fold nucleic acid binding domain-containing protein, partial [Rhodothermales bacterium]|nr:OB-fold nucleic acid binding domain-containing protein [Rhodothermales bacterium]
ELIGVYVSGHPLDAYAPEARAFATANLGDTDKFGQDEEEIPDAGGDGYGRPQKPQHTFCGIITEVQRRTTRTGKPIAFATIEDFTGQGELVCFSTTIDKVHPYLQVDEIVLARGEVEVRGGSVKILTRDIIPMWKVREQLVRAVVLRIQTGSVELADIEKLRILCDNNRGNCKLYFDLLDPDHPEGKQRIRSRTFVVDPTPELMTGISRLFGRDNVLLEGEA